MYLSPFGHGPHGEGYLPPSAHGGEYVPAEYYKENFSTYTPLVSAKREIRVLSLLPGGADTQISCQLSVKSLDLRPQFEALSYVCKFLKPLYFLLVLVASRCSLLLISLTKARKHTILYFNPR